MAQARRDETARTLPDGLAYGLPPSHPGSRAGAWSFCELEWWAGEESNLYSRWRLIYSPAQTVRRRPDPSAFRAQDRALGPAERGPESGPVRAVCYRAVLPEPGPPASTSGLRRGRGGAPGRPSRGWPPDPADGVVLPPRLAPSGPGPSPRPSRPGPSRSATSKRRPRLTCCSHATCPSGCSRSACPRDLCRRGTGPRRSRRSDTTPAGAQRPACRRSRRDGRA